jgi:hypothetical protein
MTQPVVILVLAHKPAALKDLLTVLDSRFQIIVHMDSKANVQNNSFQLPRHAVMSKSQYPIFWGGFNMCLAAISLIDTAYDVSPNFKRLVLISGDSLPTVHLDLLEESLLEKSIEIIQLIDVPNDPTLRGVNISESERRHGWGQPWRFHNFVFSDDVLYDPRARDETMQKFEIPEQRVDWLRGTAHKAMREALARLPPRPALFDKFFFGSQWWALTREAVDLIIDDMHSWISHEYFRYLHVPDEHFFHTLYGNKQRALSSLHRKTCGPLVYVDYAGAKRIPGTWPDFAMPTEGFRIAYSQHRRLFARKYDPATSPDIAAAIVNGRYFTDVIPPT